MTRAGTPADVACFRTSAVASGATETTTAATQETILSQRQVLRRLWAALDDIDPAQRAVFVLYEIEELTMAEVAEAVGCPLQTAYSRLHAARKIVEAGVEKARTGS